VLKVAVPNKGSLADAAIAILKEAGYRQRVDSRDLVLTDPENSVEFYYLRPRDIALYVGSGELEAGITGRDLLIDSGAAAIETLAMGFGGSTFRFAAPSGKNWKVSDISAKRIASAYPGLVNAHLTSLGISATVVRLDGAVESSVRLGVADLIADVVSTGNTLRQAGLEPFGEVILESSAYLIANSASSDKHAALLRRLNGVIVAREYVIFDYDCPTSLVEKASAITPGIESPTISPTKDANWVAVRALVLRSETNLKMDELYELGARAILVSAIHAARI